VAGPFSFFVEAHSHLNDTTLIRRRRETGLLLRVPDPSRFEGSGFVFLTTRNSSQGDQPSKGARAAHIQTQNCVKRARAAAERYRDLRRVAQVAGYLFHEEHSRAEYNIAGSARAVPRGCPMFVPHGRTWGFSLLDDGWQILSVFSVDEHSYFNDRTLVRRRVLTGLLLRVPDPSRFEGSGSVVLTTRNLSRSKPTLEGRESSTNSNLESRRACAGCRRALLRSEPPSTAGGWHSL